jgi:membrane protease YdiL (CAAX protease family)
MPSVTDPVAHPQPHTALETAFTPQAPVPEEAEYRGLRWVFIGRQGLRAGWSVALFLVLTIFFMGALQTVALEIDGQVPGGDTRNLTPQAALIGELTQFPAVLGAAAVLALLERRRILDYHLAGPRRIVHFAGGLAAGFIALSALVAALAWGGWLYFGPAALAGPWILGYAFLWGAVFLLTGFFEEGGFRCYLQFTLARGINFWWALALVAAMCLAGLLANAGLGVRGVYLFALLGLVPCLLLHLKKKPGAGFWQAAWVTSTFFGLIHTGNRGENWIGIFVAALIGLVFCVSVRITGSAWWAIGCHTAWDWALSYFFGAANSGMAAQGHLLTVRPAGTALWSGGSDGPEGSLLAVPIVVLLLAALVAIYRRRKPSTPPAPGLERIAS